MTAQARNLDRHITAVIETDGPQATPAAFIDGAIAAALTTEQRRPLVVALDGRAWPRGRATQVSTTFRRPALAMATVLVTAALALAAAALWVGSGPSPSPSARPTSPAPSSIGHLSHITLTDGPDSRDHLAMAIGLQGGELLALLGSPTDGMTAAILDSGRTGWRDLEQSPLPFAIPDGGPPLLLGDGRVLLFALQDQAGGVPAAVIFDPRTGRFAPGIPAGIARSFGMAVALKDGRVLVLGGQQDSNTSVIRQEIEVFDPALERWSSLGSLLDLYGQGIGPVPLLLGDGRVLVTLTSPGWGVPLDLMIIDPTTGSVTRTRVDVANGAAQLVGFSVVATRLQPDGRVLFFGEQDGTGHAPVKIWRPGELALEPFADAPPGGPSIRLRDGRFLIPDFSGGADVWDPDTGLSEYLGPFAADLPSEILLPDGQVALIGGYVRGAPIGPSGTPPLSRTVQFLSFE